MDNARARKRSAARDRDLPIKVFVNLDEREAVYKGAKAARMSASAYLRALGTGHHPRNVSDVRVVEQLAEVNSLVGSVAQTLAGRVDRSLLHKLEAAQAILTGMVRDDR